MRNGHLIERYYDDVRRLAFHTWGKLYRDPQDFMDALHVGLIVAARKFDPAKGTFVRFTIACMRRVISSKRRDYARRHPFGTHRQAGAVFDEPDVMADFTISDWLRTMRRWPPEFWPRRPLGVPMTKSRVPTKR